MTFWSRRAVRRVLTLTLLTTLTAFLQVGQSVNGAQELRLLPLAQAQEQAETLAQARLLMALQQMRANGCNNQPGVGSPLTSDQRLNKVAGDLIKTPTLDLTKALRAQGVAVNSLQTSSLKASFKTILDSNNVGLLCPLVLDAGLELIGLAQDSNQSVFLLVKPKRFPPNNAQTREEVLKHTNSARAQGRTCGDQGSFKAAGPVRLNDTLNQVAENYAKVMGSKNHFSHTGPDGTTPDQRITKGGYKWQLVEENIAAGQESPQEVVAAWVKSPHHCANLMNPMVEEMGIGFAVDARGNEYIYWTQLFGKPPKN